MAFKHMSRRWLLAWVALVAAAVVATVFVVASFGPVWLAVAGPLFAFISSVPTWVQRVLPSAAAEPSRETGAADADRQPVVATASAVEGLSQGRAEASPAAHPPHPPSYDDLVYLGDLLPSAIASTLTIRQLARQAGLPIGGVAAEEVSAARLWPDIIENAYQQGKLHSLLGRIRVCLKGRVDANELISLVDRLLAS